jgi:hypothetical protein
MKPTKYAFRDWLKDNPEPPFMEMRQEYERSRSGDIRITGVTCSECGFIKRGRDHKKTCRVRLWFKKFDQWWRQHDAHG